MKKNVFTTSIQILIVALLILAVLVPKAYSQKSMAAALVLWIGFTIGRQLWKFTTHRKKNAEPLFTRLSRQLTSMRNTFNRPVSEMPVEAEALPVVPKQTYVLEDSEAEAMLLHIALRVTEKLKSAYPDAVWQWKEKPSLHDLLAGATVRIAVENMEQFTHADIAFDRFGRIHVEPMSIGAFAMNTDDSRADEENPAEPAVVDVRAWYELIGQKMLETQITELNANGHSRLTIKENGDIVISRQKKEVLTGSLESFPGKNYWTELISILEENELNAKIAGNNLQVSWI